jgi:hypothetical protein
MRPVGKILATRFLLDTPAWDDTQLGGSATRGTGASALPFTKLMAKGASTGIFIQSFGPGPQQHGGSDEEYIKFAP